MSRYLGPIYRKSRQYGFSIYEDGREFSKYKKRDYPPGQHGQNKFRKNSLYGEQIREKQKISFLYGLRENQMRRFFRMAKGMEGSLSLNFLILLESRLDNLVFRAGFSPTRRGARQLVAHGHILLNGKKVDIPSYIVKPSSVIELSKFAKTIPLTNLLKDFKPLPFMILDENRAVKYIRYPNRSELNLDINEVSAVEWYKRYA